ncbi:MAG: SDR family oxidoreductase [Halobacteria archaeon]
MNVLVTGASGYVGNRLMEFLDGEPAVQKVIGLDVKPPPRQFRKLEFHSRDVRDPGLAALFQQTRPEVVVHLAFVLNPIHNRRLMRDIDVNGSANVLNAAAASGARKVIVASSATAYGAHPDNPEWLTESAPIRGNREFSYSSDKAEVEALCAKFAREHPGVVLTVLRPSVVVGPTQKNYLLNKVLPPRTYFMVRGLTPLMQFVHEEDMARVYQEAILKDRPGAWNVTGDGGLTMEEMAKIAGKRTVRFFMGVAKFGMGLAWLLRRIDAPPSVIPFIAYPWTMDNRKIKEEWGFRFNYTSEEAFRKLAESERGRPR